MYELPTGLLLSPEINSPVLRLQVVFFSDVDIAVSNPMAVIAPVRG